MSREHSEIRLLADRRYIRFILSYRDELEIGPVLALGADSKATRREFATPVAKMS